MECHGKSRRKLVEESSETRRRVVKHSLKSRRKLVEKSSKSCRDIAWRLRDLVGRPLDRSFSKWLQAGFGGPLGCSHLLTLAHFLGSTTPQALALDSAAFSGDAGFRDNGERIFKRSLVLDGFELVDPARLRVVSVLNDIHMRPKSRVQGLLDRLAFQREVRCRSDIGRSLS